jgi:hypothetical protein
MATTQVFNITKAPRESLLDVIVRLNPYDTWFTTNSGDSTAQQVTHEWNIDALASPTANKAVEGADITPAAEADFTRVQNSCQLIQKSFAVSKTLEASNNAGTKSIAAYLLQKKMIELKNDMEYAFLINSSEVTGTSAAARELKGVAGFVATNTASASATGIDLTATIFNNTLQLVWAQMGGTSFDVMCGGYQKRLISAFTGNTRNIQAEAKKNVQVINIYESDFGQCNIHLSTIMNASAAGSVYIFGDFSNYWRKAWLRKPEAYDLAVTGSTAAKKGIECEVTLECRNEKTGGWIKQNKSS